MRIVRLTNGVAQRLLRAREVRDTDAERVASRIVGDVKRRGDAALRAWAKRLDGVDLRREGVFIEPREILDARRAVRPDLLRAMEHAATNIRRVAERQLPRPWTLEVERGIRVSQIVRPLGAIGCYVPGGRFGLMSTLLMTAVPARVAGVKRIIVACPRPSVELLTAASIAGVTEIGRIGGAQAIAALAYGTRDVKRVEKIFGPGNRFVTAAKQIVSNFCAIDLPAGPTEALIFATRGNPRWIAADLLAQAEHAPDAIAIFVTTSAKLAQSVRNEIFLQLSKLPETNPAHQSMKRGDLILLASSVTSAVAFANAFAPEHLTLIGGERKLLDKIESSGTIFLGEWAAQPLGDYATGSNHVLPTGGWAHRRGGLNAADFVKCVSTQSVSREGFERLASTAAALARAEGLAAHENAVMVRR
jgi:histidinol dehydrogenase